MESSVFQPSAPLLSCNLAPNLSSPVKMAMREARLASHMWPLTILLVGPLQITVDKLPSGSLTWKSPGVPSKGKCSSRAPWMGGSSEPMEDTRRGSAAVRKPHVARQPKPGAGSPLRCGLPRPVRHMLTYGCPFLGARYNMMECPLGCHLKPPKLGNPPKKDRPKYTSDARTCKQRQGSILDKRKDHGSCSLGRLT